MEIRQHNQPTAARQHAGMASLVQEVAGQSTWHVIVKGLLFTEKYLRMLSQHCLSQDRQRWSERCCGAMPTAFSCLSSGVKACEPALLHSWANVQACRKSGHVS